MADAVGQVFKKAAAYEKMSIEELDESFKDDEIKEILQKVFGLDSVVYFIDKVQKMTYIANPDQRPAILEAGEDKRSVHRNANRENRSTPRAAIAERMEEETKDRSFRLNRIEKFNVEDAFTGRAIRVAYWIVDLSDGAEYAVSRGTCRWLVERGRLEDFAVKHRKSVAHNAGLKSAADLLGGEPAEVVVSTVAQPEERNEENSGSGGLSDAELDALLDTLSD
jgi:hypothetical protein